MVKKRIYHGHFPAWPIYYKTNCLKWLANFVFFQDNPTSCPLQCSLVGSGGGRVGEGASVGLWPWRWDVVWCYSSPGVPWGCGTGCGPGKLRAVLEVGTSIMLSKILGCNGCFEPPDIFYKALGHEALFPPLLPCFSSWTSTHLPLFRKFSFI